MKLNKLLLALAIAGLAAPIAHAVEPKQGYAGFTLGQATVDDFCGGGASSCDDNALSFRLHGGVALNDFVNLELGYRYIDEVEASGFIDGIALSAAVNGHFVDSTLQLGMPETGPFKVFAKAGLMLWRLNYDVVATDGFQSFSASDDDSGVALRTGLGASYEVSDKVRVRADWDLLLNVGGDDELGEADINVFSVGPEFIF